MTPTEMTAAILELVQRPKYRPAKPRVLAQRLGVPKSEVAEVKKIVKSLIAAGRLRYGAGHLVQPIEAAETGPLEASGAVPTSRPPGKRIVGSFRRNEAGYGFVRPADQPRSDGREGDIYIPAKRTKDAASGDTLATSSPAPQGRIGAVRSTPVCDSQLLALATSRPGTCAPRLRA